MLQGKDVEVFAIVSVAKQVKLHTLGMKMSRGTTGLAVAKKFLKSRGFDGGRTVATVMKAMDTYSQLYTSSLRITQEQMDKLKEGRRTTVSAYGITDFSLVETTVDLQPQFEEDELESFIVINKDNQIIGELGVN